ncbi:hypothetical protein A2U01_0111441, partial [Trifolium medium]|nr:hypothetical protein [Trifolium medium]
MEGEEPEIDPEA